MCHIQVYVTDDTNYDLYNQVVHAPVINTTNIYVDVM